MEAFLGCGASMTWRRSGRERGEKNKRGKHRVKMMLKKQVRKQGNKIFSNNQVDEKVPMNYNKKQ